MFEEIVRFQASLHPTRPAVITPDGVINFRRLNADMRRFAHRLKDVARQGSTAALALDRPYQHIVARGALSMLGVTFVAAPIQNRRKLLELISPDLVLWPHDAGPPPGKAVVLDGSWWSLPEPDGPIVPERPLTSEDPAAILVSSGTTGLPKKVLFRRGQIDDRYQAFADALQVGPGDRVLSLMGLDTAGGSGAQVVAWMWGGAWVSSPKLLFGVPGRPELRPNLLIASPEQLRSVVASLPDDHKPDPDLNIWTVGSALPATVSEAVRSRLSPRLHLSYGSTEAGSIAGAMAADLQDREGATGYAYPWAEIEIVGEDGSVLPAGELGEIRVRSPGMATAYLDDEETSQTCFRDGWFHPGDLGTLDRNGLLTVSGRIGELINIGGVKIACISLEAAALSAEGVADAGACELKDPRDLASAWVGVVAEGEIDPDALRSALAGRFGPRTIQIARVDSIPRNAMGKILRGPLAEAVQSAGPLVAAEQPPKPAKRGLGSLLRRSKAR